MGNGMAAGELPARPRVEYNETSRPTSRPTRLKRSRKFQKAQERDRFRDGTKDGQGSYEGTKGGDGAKAAERTKWMKSEDPK